MGFHRFQECMETLSYKMIVFDTCTCCSEFFVSGNFCFSFVFGYGHVMYANETEKK